MAITIDSPIQIIIKINRQQLLFMKMLKESFILQTLTESIQKINPYDFFKYQQIQYQIFTMKGLSISSTEEQIEVKNQNYSQRLLFYIAIMVGIACILSSVYVMNVSNKYQTSLKMAYQELSDLQYLINQTNKLIDQYNAIESQGKDDDDRIVISDTQQSGKKAGRQIWLTQTLRRKQENRTIQKQAYQKGFYQGSEKGKSAGLSYSYIQSRILLQGTSNGSIYDYQSDLGYLPLVIDEQLPGNYLYKSLGAFYEQFKVGEALIVNSEWTYHAFSEFTINQQRMQLFKSDNIAQKIRFRKPKSIQYFYKQEQFVNIQKLFNSLTNKNAIMIVLYWNNLKQYQATNISLIERLSSKLSNRKFIYNEAFSLNMRRIQGKPLMIFLGQDFTKRKVNAGPPALTKSAPYRISMHTQFNIDQDVYNLKEWLIYNIALGVQKFFIYDISPLSALQCDMEECVCYDSTLSERKQILRNILQDYYQYIVYVPWSRGKTQQYLIPTHVDYLKYFRDLSLYTVFSRINQLIVIDSQSTLKDLLDKYENDRKVIIQIPNIVYLNRVCSKNMLSSIQFEQMNPSHDHVLSTVIVRNSQIKSGKSLRDFKAKIKHDESIITKSSNNEIKVHQFVSRSSSQKQYKRIQHSEKFKQIKKQVEQQCGDKCRPVSIKTCPNAVKSKADEFCPNLI